RRALPRRVGRQPARPQPARLRRRRPDRAVRRHQGHRHAADPVRTRVRPKETIVRAPLAVFLSLTLLCGAAYPALVTVGAALLFPGAAHGSVILQDGRARGSSLIGQSFDRPEFFWGRLSATAPVPYSPFDGASGNGSTGSNYGPLHPDLIKAAQAR